MKTKWGNAKIDGTGYYRITSAKEGNHKQFLHRLIWEDFWGTEVPKGYVIHHKNDNKLDNCILNLQLMRDKDHRRLHRTGVNFKHSDKTKENMSKAKNTTGFLNVSKWKCKSCNQGFTWRYRYYENGKETAITSVDIEKLEAKVKARGLPWKKLEA